MAVIKFIIHLLGWYYITAPALVAAILLGMRGVYRREKAPIPWRLYLYISLIPIVGAFISMLAIYFDFARHVLNVEHENYQRDKDNHAWPKL